MEITQMKIADVIPYERNPRINDAAVEAVAKSPPVKIKGRIYKGNYFVTSNGSVFTMTFKGKLRIKQQRLRKHSHGYLRTNIFQRDEYVHRIVARCFVENPHGYLEVNHKDGDKANNSASNLEWCTRSENNLHAFRIGLRTNEEMAKYARMPKLKSRKFTDSQVAAIREMLHKGYSDTVIARQFNCWKSRIWQIRTGKIYKEETTNA